MSDMTKHERAFEFIRMNERQGKPRTRGLTEIRGPYYTVMGKRYLEDILGHETLSHGFILSYHLLAGGQVV